MSRRQRKNLWRIIGAAGIFALSFFSGSFGVFLLLAAYLVVGYDVLLSALRKIFSANIFDEEFLMTLATVGAILMREFPEAVTVMLLYQTGELFQGVAVGKSRKSIKELMKIKPDFARALREEREIKLAPEKVAVGEVILVLPGEKVPLDGIIIEGESSFDTSSLTGESMPLAAKMGDRAVSGMINLDCPVKVRVTSVYGQSTVAKILQLVETSSMHKSRSEKFITKFSRKYTPCVFIAALITAFVPPLLFMQPLFVWIRRALVFLVVSCPCALVISVPLSFFGGLGAASGKGILIKGSTHLEKLAKVTKIAFDKTGTLTLGGFSVTEVIPNGIDEEKLLEIAALAESFSNHPIALSIVKHYGKEIDKTRTQNVFNISGSGIKAEVDGKEVLAGNRKLLSENGVKLEVAECNDTAVYIAQCGKYLGCIKLSDKIKPEAKGALTALKALGIKDTVILTGDNEAIACRVGESVGADKVYAGLMPQDKVDIALRLKNDGEGVLAFAGDGINDAPVLSCVDVGIAMGALGSDAAIEAADVVIMNDSLSSVGEAVKISRKTMRIVRQNIVLSLSVKFGVMILSTMGFDNMYAAIFADVGVMVLAVLNAMRMVLVKK